jgi:hypothetical protein
MFDDLIINSDIRDVEDSETGVIASVETSDCWDTCAVWSTEQIPNYVWVAD